MGQQCVQSSAVWALIRRQRGVITRRQLLALGYNADAIHHRLATGRLHLIWEGVYAAGRPQLTRHGIWLAAVLACGEDAALSHTDAGGLYGIIAAPALPDLSALATGRGRPIHVSVPLRRCPRRPGIAVHRRAWLTPTQIILRDDIPVTSPACTLIDLAAVLPRDQLEAAINAADKRDLIGPESLRAALESVGRRPGVAVLRELLDRRTFTLTDSELERRFLPIARAAGLPPPLTQHRVNGFRVDFFWPKLGLVVETDGLRYHRTPAEQARDRIRDQVHIAAGLTPLRFTHAQIHYDYEHVRVALARTVTRLQDD
jgi:very-short-patch-repair endonuclease